MSRFKQRVRQRRRNNPEIAAGYDAHPYVACKPLPDARTLLPHIIHAKWRRWAFLPLGGMAFFAIMAATSGQFGSGTKLLEMTVAILFMGGVLALPMLLAYSITFELTEDHLLRRGMCVATRDLPYSAIRSIKIDHRVITNRGIMHMYLLIIKDTQGTKMHINMATFRHEDLRTIINTIVTHAPHVRLDPSARAFEAGQIVFLY